MIALVLSGALKPCLVSSSRDASLDREIPRAGRLILDRLQTERRHVVATGFIWIGKEANDIGESGEASHREGGSSVQNQRPDRNSNASGYDMVGKQQPRMAQMDRDSTRRDPI